MLKVSKLSDYATLLLLWLAMSEWRARTAQDIAAAVALPLPTVSKLLKILTRAGLLRSERGVRGGYRLAREPGNISLAEVVQAVDGPIAITDCSGEDARCARAGDCLARPHWRNINQVIHHALSGVTLASLNESPGEAGATSTRLPRFNQAVISKE